MLNWVEHEKSFITSGPVLIAKQLTRRKCFIECAQSKYSDQNAHVQSFENPF